MLKDRTVGGEESSPLAHPADMKILALLALACSLQAASGSPLSIQKQDFFSRRTRSEAGQLGCIQLKTKARDYWYISDSVGDAVCGLYLISSPDEVIEIEFEYFSIDCQGGGLLTYIDGWEADDEFFPSPDEEGLELVNRFQNFCGANRPDSIYISSHNVVLLQYNVPIKDQGFKIRTRFTKNPRPCNAVSVNESGYYTIRNYGRRTNCSVSVIFPETVQFLSVDVGVTAEENGISHETGRSSQCLSQNGGDYVELRAGNGLDPSFMYRHAAICGLDSTIKKSRYLLGCQHSVIRLVSSGKFFNSVTFAYKVPTPELLAKADPDTCWQ